MAENTKGEKLDETLPVGEVARHDWVSGSIFHPMEQAEVLKKVLEAVRHLNFLNQRPMVLLDLDSTLYEVSARTLTILNELLSHSDFVLPLGMRELILELTLERIGYSLPDTFRLSGVHVEKEPEWQRVLPIIRDFWKDRFFSDPYLSFDRPYAGAAEYVKALHGAGAEIVYLTGREAARMKEGTKKNLVRDGFPWEVPRTHLWMKENSQWDDLYHKQHTARSLLSLGTPVASFENEPRNIAGLIEVFPEAMHIFVETICSELPAPVCRGLYRIKSFLF
jgi:hypothetical protein